jgi:hypothetical protein
MGVASWLEPVLSWPRRFIVGHDEEAEASGGKALVTSGEPG